MKFPQTSLLLTAFGHGALVTSDVLQNPPLSQEANASNTYDYIVTGSGPGGGTLAVNLALSGSSVLLLEAGSDASSDLTTQILALTPSPSATWGFFVQRNSDASSAARHNLMVWRLPGGELWVGRDPASEGHTGAVRLGVYYPRGATLGGSAVVNAAAAFLPSDADWEAFGDGVWSGEEMRRVFERIERSNYLEKGTPGHGFGGWLQTNAAERRDYPEGMKKLKVIRAALKLLGKDPNKVVEYLTSDANFLDPGRDEMQGLYALPFHATKGWRRFSPRDRILATCNETDENGTRKYALHVRLNSLTTRVLFEKDDTNAKPRAVGVEYLEGPSVYKADARNNGTRGKPGRAFARKEVIVSGGTFNSPQILQLSGVGPRALLEKHGIPVIVDLPGVGRNLQDNYEMPVVGHAQQKISDPVDPSAPNCTAGAPGDPCVDLWKQGKGPYAHAGGNAYCLLLKTTHSPDGERDMLLFSTPAGAFRGFKPATNQNFSDPPETTAWSTVKMHPQNHAGYVRIRSADPRDTPEINFNHFVDGAETDVGAILDAVAFGRRSFFGTEAPVGPVVPKEPPCPAADIREDGYCRDAATDRQWIEDQVFGHHATSSNSVGPASNPLAVLDTRLRVRGVERLRVVDASAFPRIPGAFPAVATFMLSEKASELVLEDAKYL